MTSKTGKPLVAIVGGSFAGQRARQVLDKYAKAVDYVMIDPREFWEYQPSASRALVDPSNAVLTAHSLPPAKLLRKLVRFVARSDEQDPRARVDIVFDDGTDLQADYVLLCMGSMAGSPIKARCDRLVSESEQRAELAACAGALEHAQRVCIVGGGPTAVEVASQVVERYGSAKEVTLVCADDALLSHLVPEASRRAHAWLVSREVRVLTGHRVVDWGTGADEQHSESRTIGDSDPAGPPPPALEVGQRTVVTDRGERVVADVVLRCTGVTPYWRVAGKLPCLRGLPDGQASGVPVNAHLQVMGEVRVFAAGDCMDLPFERTIMLAQTSAKVAATNIVRLAQAEAAAARPGARGAHPPELLRFPEDPMRGSARLPVVAAVALGGAAGVLQEEDRVHPRSTKAVSLRRKQMQQTLSVQRGSRIAAKLASMAESRLPRAINPNWQPQKAWKSTASRLLVANAVAAGARDTRGTPTTPAAATAVHPAPATGDEKGDAGQESHGGADGDAQSHVHAGEAKEKHNRQWVNAAKVG